LSRRCAHIVDEEQYQENIPTTAASDSRLVHIRRFELQRNHTDPLPITPPLPAGRRLAVEHRSINFWSAVMRFSCADHAARPSWVCARAGRLLPRGALAPLVCWASSEILPWLFPCWPRAPPFVTQFCGFHAGGFLHSPASGCNFCRVSAVTKFVHRHAGLPSALRSQAGPLRLSRG